MSINYPANTYRIQFNKDFSVKSLVKIAEYLHKLGVQTIYASPIFEAVPGSGHGYDVTDPLQINPEIASLEQLKESISKFKAMEIDWLQDIVPNHMAFHQNNKWLMDVLEKGAQSAYATFFDVGLDKEKLMVPFLGAPIETVIEQNELSIVYNDKRFQLKYFDSLFPVNAIGYEVLLKEGSEHIERRIQEVNSDKQQLAEIVSMQYYRLCHWQETEKHINYRRFFLVNGLICLNIQNENVFNQYHELIKLLVEDGFFTGLRVDHIDGLYDPAGYLEQLKKLTDRDVYSVVEKILERGEKLPPQWKTEGTTGYDFLSLVNNLLTNGTNKDPFTEFYEELIDDYTPVDEQVPEKKALILDKSMGGELDNLHRLLLSFIDKKLLAPLFEKDLKIAIAAFLVHCPVYRYYGNSIPFKKEEAGEIGNIISKMREEARCSSDAINLLEKVFLDIPQNASEDVRMKTLHFYKRCMQYSGPLMAKGVEDTLMYTYNAFAAHNEVGDSPASFGISVDDFNEAMIERQRNWPLTMNATSTHDTKRGEDVRARLNVLSDIPNEWFAIVAKWRQLNMSLKNNGTPGANEEYLIYQSLIGAYPMDGRADQQFSERFAAYLTKALREAKINSGWSAPDEEYESKCIEFSRALFKTDSPFNKSFHEFHKRIVDFGIINSLTQLVLKFTCPGIPDTYQGSESWDLSFVDPDNRRQVDFDKHLKLLDSLESMPIEDKEDFIQSLWKDRNKGQIKMWATQRLMKLRKQQSHFFTNSQYIPLKVEGETARFVMAFARHHEQKWLVTIVPLHLAELCRQQGTDDVLAIDWKDTHVVLPSRLKATGEDVLWNGKLEVQRKLSLKKAFKRFPLVLLEMETLDNPREAGVLLHISSLPSEFGIGDLGPQAYKFVDILSECHQKLWQVLPLNPVDASQSYSPYSSISTHAGNTFLISPEVLASDGLIDSNMLDEFKLPNTAKVNFKELGKKKEKLLNHVWRSASLDRNTAIWKQFQEFSILESSWLNDFALYVAIKNSQDGKPWFQWTDGLKKRDAGLLLKIGEENKEEIEKIKFLQFIFYHQWLQLKNYCHSKKIKIVGDLPFYVSHDSVDVWAHPEIFSVDGEGNLLAVAGTPPDAFSSEGQNWGMPVYKWEKLEESEYQWWVARIKTNKENFDLVRLDHFRAFSAYWEVPKDGSAKNGSWKPANGKELLDAIKNELGHLSFVAEDLGEIDEEVIALRDQFNLPGMKVLQFAFESNMTLSDYIPHNYSTNFFVYPGTHDNNTTRGWFRQNADEATKSRLQQYFDKAFKEEAIAYEFIRAAYASVATTVVIAFQDILNLDETARMNNPSTLENNWNWRLTPDQLDIQKLSNIKSWVSLFNRGR